MALDHNIVSVSGGKDSTALLLLAIERGAENMRTVFADTGHEHPEVYRYLDYLEARLQLTIERIKPDFSRQIARQREVVQTKWRAEGVSEQVIQNALAVLHPTGIPFLDLCMWKGRFPSMKARFCTTELKKKPIEEQVLAPLLNDPDTQDVYSWQGVRRDESPDRALLVEQEEIGDGLFAYRPILDWAAQDVFDFHRKHGVKWNPLYEQGMSRVGCMPCINCRKNELQAISKRYPEEVDRVAEWERLVSQASKRQGSSFFGPSKMPGSVKGLSHAEAQARLSIHNVVEWSMTGKGGRTFDLIAMLDPGEGCASAYGLCESAAGGN
ncbi:phosphoadenosine phosphosulfate reductase [Zobellella denitrificans]|uniref:phosphoadenosine phosphosulfate reductase domain-containing protein n=1 Tax=Zobellella denitrificans TaxID=347534 RepID=UPI000B8C659D|nr:phosphoadenosine phosphosulfate reductase family protein [Zobellella denitrificans]OXS14907.1 phosphoadenosine phosphosulfate reductase [Zobellella denitrificans]